MKSFRDPAPGTKHVPARAPLGSQAKPVQSTVLTLQSLAGNKAVAAACSSQRNAASASSALLQREAVTAELTGPAQPPAPIAERLLRSGSQGEDVRHAQARLNAHGAAPPLAADGIFGPFTRRGTIAFQNSHALTPDGVIGPKTSASLEGPTDVGGSSGQSRTPPAGPQPGQVLRYDTTAYTITPPPAGTTRATLNQQVQQRQSNRPPDLGPTVTVVGVPPNSQAEIFVWNVLVQLGLRSRWGTEADLVTAIGRASTNPARPAPVGRVTLRIDNSGNAAATLVGTGPVVPGPVFPTREAAVAALRALGFANVLDGSAPWTLPELSKAHNALSQLPAADLAALNGVDLVRDRTLTLNGRPLAGRFEHSATLAVGATTATRSASLRIADLAFAGDNLSFIGDASASGPASSETFVHEAAHAVETKALRDAQFARLQAQGDLNGRITVQNAAITAFNASSGVAFAATSSPTSTPITSRRSRNTPRTTGPTTPTSSMPRHTHCG